MNTLKIHRLSKTYGNKKALDDFSFQIEPGEIVGLIGKNGAGKTTLLNCIAGNIFPSSGTIYFNDKDLSIDNSLRQEFGILIQPSFLDYMNTYDNLRLLQNTIGIWDPKTIRTKSDEVLKIVGLEGVGKKYVKSFSFGMKQRLGFAQALLNGSEFLILDEPFVGLDISGRAMVKQYIKQLAKKKNIGVIFSDHNLDEVRSLCERVIVIHDGRKIYDGGLIKGESYEIYVEEITNDLIHTLSAFPEVEINTQQSKVLFEGATSLHKIISSIVTHARITHIISSDNNLENLLKGE